MLVRLLVFLLTLTCFVVIRRLILLLRLTSSTCEFFVVLSDLFLKLKKIFAARVAYTPHRTKGKTSCNSKEELPK